MTLANVIDVVKANYGTILAAAYALLNLANALLKGATAQGVIAKIADALAFLTRAEAAGTLKLPLVQMSAPSSAGPKATSPASLKALALLPAALLAALGASGCAACKLAANSTTPKCVFESAAAACGETDLVSLIPVAAELVIELASGMFDPAAFVTLLEGQGFKDVPCLLAALETYVGSAAAIDPNIRPLLKAAAHAALLAAQAKTAGK